MLERSIIYSVKLTLGFTYKAFNNGKNYICFQIIFILWILCSFPDIKINDLKGHIYQLISFEFCQVHNMTISIKSLSCIYLKELHLYKCHVWFTKFWSNNFDISHALHCSVTKKNEFKIQKLLYKIYWSLKNMASKI